VDHQTKREIFTKRKSVPTSSRGSDDFELYEAFNNIILKQEMPFEATNQLIPVVRKVVQVRYKSHNRMAVDANDLSKGLDPH
jgi:hypothetical protein